MHSEPYYPQFQGQKMNPPSSGEIAQDGSLKLGRCGGDFGIWFLEEEWGRQTWQRLLVCPWHASLSAFTGPRCMGGGTWPTGHTGAWAIACVHA